MDLNNQSQQFLSHMNSRYYSTHTLRNYEIDINQFITFMETRDVINESHIHEYLMYLASQGYQRTTYSRKISSLRMFIKFISNDNGEIIHNIHIFKTETLTEDLNKYGYNYIRQKIGKEKRYTTSQYSNYLSNKSIDLINNFYKKDFELFNYQMIIPSSSKFPDNRIIISPSKYLNYQKSNIINFSENLVEDAINKLQI
mgnify:CR=1 FL=1